MRSELYLNNVRVDLKEEIQCSLNLMIADIREPKTRKGSFSKTITLPGSKTLNALLGGIFEISEDIQTSGVVNFVPDFNPNLKCSAILYADGLEQFRGNMKLVSIERDQQNHAFINYNVVLFGEVANIYSAIADSKMTDLSLAEYNHTYNKTNQKATWTATNYGTGYVYPMINYGNIPAGGWDVTNFYPAVYLKTYIDKIFSAAGYTYTSTFFNSTFFKRLIVPFAGTSMTITSAQVTARLFAANTTVATSGVAATVDPIIYNSETSDPSNQYDITSGIFTVANSGYYSFYSSGVITYDAITSCTGTGASYSNIQLLQSGSVVAYYPMGGSSFSSTSSYSSGAVINTYSYSGWSPTIYCVVGDTIHIKSSELLLITGTVGKTISANSIFYNRITNTQIVDGNSLDMASALPTDVKQSDFLTSIFRYWNLYCEPDKTTPNNLIVDTYDDFYGTGSTRDWTKKVDASQVMSIVPMGALDARRYRLKHADDTDYWNKYYSDKWKETYGEKDLDITNDFLKNTNVNEVIFAATPIIGSNSHDRIIPEIYSLSNSGVQTPIRSKMRILYWGGALATTNSWNYTSTISGTSAETTYPYSGHLDNPYSPTLDLSFGVPREIYYVNPYGLTSYTTDNTYNRYHSKFLSEITDRNSKLVTLYVRLRPLDINLISFRDNIYIDGHYYRLQKVIDYNPIAEGVTKVELLKIKTGATFTPVVHTIDFTLNAAIDIGNKAPAAGGNIGVGDVGSSSLNTSSGTKNVISTTAMGTIINGSSNRIGNNTSNIGIFSSSGVAVMDGISNVTVINTNDIIITESNVVYVNGLKVAGSSDITSISASRTITKLGRWECSGAIIITLSSSLFRTGDMITIKNIGSGVVTVSGGGINIDSSATFLLSVPMQSVDIYYNGTVYYIQ